MKKNTRIKGQRIRVQKGSVLIEFALSMLLYFALFSGIFGFGYSLNAYSMVQNAVRDGARYASRKPYDSASATPSQTFLSAVKNRVVYSDPAGGTVPVVRGLATSNVQLDVTMSGSAPTQMTVSIINFNVDAVFFQYNMNGFPSVTFPYLGIPTPP